MIIQRFSAQIFALLLTLCSSSAVFPARDEGVSDDAFSVPYEAAIKGMNDGEFDAAVIHLKNVLQDNPDHIPARILLGQAYLRQGRGSAAEKELRNALWRGADEDHIFVPLGNALLLQRKYDVILEDIKSSKPGFTGNFEVHTLRGRANFELDRLGAAEKDFERAIELAADEINPLLGLAQVYAAQGKHSDALSFISRAHDIAPENAEAWFQHAQVLRSIGEYDDALKSYDKALKSMPLHVRARVGRASLALYRGDLKLAATDAEYILEKAPNNATAPFVLWQTYLRLGRKQESEAAFRIAADRIASMTDGKIGMQPSLLRIAGLIAVAKGDHERANRYLTELVVAQPHDLSIRKLLAEVQLRIGANDSAVRTLYDLSKKMPNDAAVFSLLGQAYMNIRQYREASAALERALDLTPDSESVRAQLALSRVGFGETDAAIADLKKIVDLDSVQTSTGILLATLQLKAGELIDALETVGHLNKIYPDNPVVMNLLGTVLLARPDRPKAEAAFLTAVEIDPNFIPAMYNLGQMHLDAGDTDGAERWYVQVLEQDRRSIEALIGLSEVAIARGKLKTAVNILQAAIATDPSRPEAFVSLIESHMAMGQSNDALRVAERFLQEHFGQMAPYEMMGRTKAALGKRDEAMLSFRRAKDAAGFDGEVLLRLAQGQVSINDFEGAKSTLIKATRSDRADDAVAALVRLDLTQRELEGAMKRAQHFREESPDKALSHILFGEVQMASGDFTGAEASYRRALELDSGADQIIGLSSALVAQRRIDESLSTMSQWIADNPDNLYVEREYALRLISLQRLDPAQTVLERLAELVPDDPLTLSTLARCYQLNRDSRARATAEAAYKLRPDWSVSADTLGWIMVTQGEVAEGLKLLREAFSRDKNPLIRFHIASALHQLGRNQEAGRELEAIMRRGSGLPWIADVENLYRTIQ